MNRVPSPSPSLLILGMSGLALVACGDKESDAGVSSADYAALSERVAVLESQLGGGDGGGGDGGTTDLQSLQDSVDANAAALASTQAELAAVQEDVDGLTTAVTDLSGLVEGIDLSSVSTRLDTVEADVAEVGVRGGVWYDEGTSSGTCARVDVVTDSDRPLVAIATVEYSTSAYLAACYTTSSYYCSGYSSSDSDSGSVSGVLVSKNVGGTSFSDSSSLSGGAGYSLGFSNNSMTSGYAMSALNVSDSRTISASRVLEIPSSGSYTVEAQLTVSGSASVTGCRLVVVQP